MKDLYRRLGYSSIRDSIENTRIQAVAQHDPKGARTCHHILLNPKRKAVYDRNRQLMATIGCIRANLGLTRAANWTSVDYHDFDYEATGRPSELETLRQRLTERTKPKPFGMWVAWILVMLVIVAIIGAPMLVNYQTRIRPRLSNYQRPPETLKSTLPDKSSGVLKARSTVRPVTTEASPFSEPALPLPPNGSVTRTSNLEPVAPLQIITRSGDSMNYYVKIVDWYDKSNTILTIFVRGGQTVTTDVPLGFYDLRYAGGKTWYGAEHRFGPDTIYSRADHQFSFTSTLEKVSGYTVELFLQPHGNLSIEQIDPEDF